jgi:hypothetical protein
MLNTRLKIILGLSSIILLATRDFRARKMKPVTVERKDASVEEGLWVTLKGQALDF